MSFVGKSVLIRHPAVGSVWMDVKMDENGYVEGLVWDDSEIGSPLYPDDYSGQDEWMNFPRSCVVKVSP